VSLWRVQAVHTRREGGQSENPGRCEEKVGSQYAVRITMLMVHQAPLFPCSSSLSGDDDFLSVNSLNRLAQSLRQTEDRQS
jgi:hypothetical protein